jgi:hypothetical protein
MCDCITTMDDKLKDHNTRISVGFLLDRLSGGMSLRPIIATEKIDKKARIKMVEPIPTYCPFCGEKYEAK